MTPPPCPDMDTWLLSLGPLARPLIGSNNSLKRKKRTYNRGSRRIRITASAATILFPNIPAHLLLAFACASARGYCTLFLLSVVKPATAQLYTLQSLWCREGPFVGRTGSLDLDVRSVSVAMSR